MIDDYLDAEEKEVSEFKKGLEKGVTCPFCQGEGCENCDWKSWI